MFVYCRERSLSPISALALCFLLLPQIATLEYAREHCMRRKYGTSRLRGNVVRIYPNPGGLCKTSLFPNKQLVVCGCKTYIGACKIWWFLANTDVSYMV